MNVLLKESSFHARFLHKPQKQLHVPRVTTPDDLIDGNIRSEYTNSLIHETRVGGKLSFFTPRYSFPARKNIFL
jgi:hypothetical protein